MVEETESLRQHIVMRENVPQRTVHQSSRPSFHNQKARPNRQDKGSRQKYL